MVDAKLATLGPSESDCGNIVPGTSMSSFMIQFVLVSFSTEEMIYIHQPPRKSKSIYCINLYRRLRKKKKKQYQYEQYHWLQ